MNNSNLISDSIKILVESTDTKTYGSEYASVKTILEDANSPVTRKYQEKLFQSIIDKKHVDFGDIPKSAGNIKAYSGYNNMMEVLNTIDGLANEQKNKEVMGYVAVVKKAISNIENLSSSYAKGFINKSDYVMLEYNTYVYTCIEATSSLLYEFVEYIKRPDQQVMSIQLKNTKYRANLYYFDQLNKFNNVNAKMGMDYRKLIESLCNKGRNNFLGAEMIVGVAALSMAALAIVPLTRELIYRFYHMRSNLAQSLELQAEFLEMNKTCLEANDSITTEKKKKILEKQNKTRLRLLKLADIIRVKNAKGMNETKKDLDDDNKLLSINNLQDEISNSPFELA
jgi:hypothetical protein